jgi:tetratricopeptide (TPR) repeat protein
VSRYPQAEHLHLEVLDLQLRTLGPDHPALATTYYNLGFLMPYLGRDEASEQYYRQVLALRRRHLPEDEPSIGQALVSIGNVLRRRGLYPEADEQYREAMAHHDRYGHRMDAVWARFQLGLSLKNQFRFAESIGVLDEGLALGGSNDHPSLAILHLTLGDVHRLAGNPVQSEHHTITGAELRIRLFGADHLEAAGSLIAMGMILARKGRHSEAEELIYQGAEVVERTLGRDHADYAATLVHLAEFESLRGQHTMAERYYLEAIAGLERHKTHDVLQRGIVKRYLGRLYVSAGRADEAEQVLLDAYDTMRRKVEPRHSEMQALLLDISDMYRAMHRTEEAAGYEALLISR